MIPIFKLRGKYLKRHPCSLIVGYLFIPVVLLFIFLPGSIIKSIIYHGKEKYRYNYYDYSINPKNNKLIKNFISNNLNNTAIIVNNVHNGEELRKFIKKESNKEIDYYLGKSELVNKKYDNFIIYNQKEGKNEFQLEVNDKLDFNISNFKINKINDLKKIFNLKNLKNLKYLFHFKKEYDYSNNFRSLIIKYLATEKNINNYTNITINTDFKSFSSLGESRGDLETTDIYIGLIVSLEMTLMSYYLTERMIEEKENKLNDFLERQGITKKRYILSWFVTYSILGLLPFASFCCFCGFFMIFQYIFTFINLVLYMLSIYSVIFFFFTSISSLKKGSIIIKLFNFVSTLIGCALSIPKTKRTIKLIFCFIPHINIYYTISVMYTISDIYNFSGNILVKRVKEISYLESLLFFIGEIIIYSSLSLFIQSYKNSGLSFGLYLKSFCTTVSDDERNQGNEPLIRENDEVINILNYETHHQQLSLIQQQKRNENKCLKIVGATKQFGNLKAVNNVSCELFSNEIFCLLGHNGAGKTTLVNLISGLMEPEKGDIFLNGRSLLTNKDFLYENIGLCQQENILFDYLTVVEHFQYIYDIKGIERNFNEIQELIIKLNLSDVEFRVCKDLSGGQKRKLCIALALLSGGKIIILDEPTSGMDVIAKKQLWEFLKNYQKDKIILITTHSLEEAEYLGTRIGIMTDGLLICSGTSTYLKSMYPCGININLVINSRTFNDENKRIIYEKIKEYDPQAEIKIASKGVFTINIQQNNDHISEIFDYIEQIKLEYGIEDYIVGSASLEDVFLKINNKSNIKDMKYLKQNPENIIIPELRANPAGFFPQLGSQLYRDLLPILRNKIIFVLEYLGGLSCSYIFTIFFKDIFFKEYDNDTLFLFGLSIIFGYIVYLGGIVYEKIKERKTKTKYLLYLSGCNMWSYWVAFFLIDLIKLIIFNALLLIPIYISSNLGMYYFISLCFMSMSSLVFIYFFSSFMRDEDSGTKILLISIVVTAVIIGLLYAFIISPLARKNETIYDIFFNFVYKRFYLTLFDLTPISSLALTLYRITEANIYYDGFDSSYSQKIGKYYHPIQYLLSGIMTQFMNFIMYFTLMLLNEKGYLARLHNKMHSSESPFTFSEENAAEEFYASNNFRNPLLMAQDNNDNNNNNNQNIMPNDINNLNANNNNQNNNINNNNYLDNINNNANNINSINDSRSQSENIIDIDTSSNQNNINNNNINNNINNINNINNNNINNINNSNNNVLNNQINQINRLYQNYQNNYQQIQPNNLYNQDNNNIGPRQNNQLNNINPFIRAEIQKINNQRNLTTKIIGLYKTFFYTCKKNVRVVNNLYLGLEPNEKFGLLGFNGSGKTTTFRAITNEILYEKGTISLFGYDNKTQFDLIRPMIGYCPQENPLFDYMKVREIIAFYLKLKHSTETIESICNTFDLYQYLDTYCVNLSGGNKRKLTFAIALMNKPNLLLLDEPSTGVDPESRRIMWKNINELSNTGHKYNMILTTHSIEEAEILCDRVSWLKHGNFACIGNPEQLKLKYSNGYKMHIKFVDTVINRNDVSTLTRKMVQDDYIAITNLVQDFNKYSNYIMSTPIITLYIRVLIQVAQEIKPNTSRLKLLQIGKDFSFELEVGIIKEKQKLLFSQIFNLKKKNPKIDEISINLESLGNILTLFR